MKTHKNIVSIVVAITLILIIVVFRALPLLPNFAPVAAVALFGAFFFSNRLLGWLIAMIGMLISDAFFLDHYSMQMMMINYLALSFPVLWAPLAGKYIKHLTAMSGLKLFGLISLGSLMFFLVSNLGVWLYGQMYVPNLGGLIMCYIAALPFLLSTWASDLFFGTILFGAYKKITISKIQLVFLEKNA